MNDTLLLALLALTTWRITWLITRDSFPPARAVREAIITQARATGTPTSIDADGHRDPDGGYEELRGGWSAAAELITCPWCVSIWVSTAVVWPVNAWRHLDLPVLWWGGTAALAAILAAILDKVQESSAEE